MPKRNHRYFVVALDWKKSTNYYRLYSPVRLMIFASAWVGAIKSMLKLSSRNRRVVQNRIPTVGSSQKQLWTKLSLPQKYWAIGASVLVSGKLSNLMSTNDCYLPNEFYWNYSMQHLLGKNVRSIILTSGTLAPLKPLISELDIPIAVNLENPHIVDSSQVCVKIISHGSDREQLNSNYENRYEF